VIDDNGRFSERVFDNIFEPYVSTKPGAAGLSRHREKIVEEHGGVIAAESNSEGARASGFAANSRGG
jgi:nitrogen fixation/metabolism regulation signal transduction histidine kinase